VRRACKQNYNLQQEENSLLSWCTDKRSLFQLHYKKIYKESLATEPSAQRVCCEP
ncbi:hypothetical protein P7K49_029882, partial [Saguinus oedipus]